MLNITAMHTLRPAVADDAPALRWLAERDEQPPLRGPVLLAEVDGRPLAALSLADGRVTADPFRPTARLIEFMRGCAEEWRPAERRSLLGRLREHARPIVAGRTLLAHRPQS
jgi:hypothetical protein